MRKSTMIVVAIVVLATVFGGGLALAGGHNFDPDTTIEIGVGVKNSNSLKADLSARANANANAKAIGINKNNNTNVNNLNQEQDQKQKQKQQQSQSINNSGNSTINNSGNSSINNSGNATIGDVKASVGDVTTGDQTTNVDVGGQYTNVGGQTATQSITFEDKREHITALPGTTGEFVFAPTTIMGEDWVQVKCSLYQSLTDEMLENASESGSFFGKKGGKFFSRRVKAVVLVPISGASNNLPVQILNWEPDPRYYGLLAEINVEGDYGYPMGSSLARALKEAKKLTGTNLVAVYYRVRKDATNSGMSIGSGGAGSALGGANADSVAFSGALGGLLGNTYAYINEAIDIKVYALEGPTAPPPGITVCGQPPVVQAPPVIIEQPLPEPRRCDDREIRERIRILKENISRCKNWGIDNLRLRFEKGTVNIDLAVCTGENGYFHEAIKDFEIAEKNYKRGRDIKVHQTEADEIIAKVYWNWAFALREGKSREAEVSFAKNHRKILGGEMPESINELRR